MKNRFVNLGLSAATTAQSAAAETRRSKKLIGSTVCWIIGVLLPWHQLAAIDVIHVDRSDGGMVVSDSAVASRIGRDVLMRGGNAVDAAVATAFALAVSWPDAGNIGGGGFMMVRPADGREPVCIDYRETAPLAMHAKSFTTEDTTHTQKAVGVPGTVRGLAKAHSRYGRVPWSELVMPAAELAREGVPVDLPLAKSLNDVLGIDEVETDEKYAELRRVYGKPDRSRWRVGDRLVLPDLASTLTEIAERGPDAFYSGRIAKLIVDEMKRGDGMIAMEDLQSYEAIARPALRGTYREYTILGAPPPSSGGTCVVEALNILENFDLDSRGRYDARNIHLIAEALRRAFADRAQFLGDPEFTEIPERLTTKAYAKSLAKKIDTGRATKSEALTPQVELTNESPDTTHFSVVDASGMAVSNTYTLEGLWGSRIVVRDAGFVLNNEMGDFNWFPGVTTRQGRIGTDANLVAPGKRMLSSQSPTIIERDGELYLVIGSPGGRTIISTVLCIALNVLEFDMNIADAVAAPRMHHQWFPDRIDLENMRVDPHKSLETQLSAMGHSFRNRPRQGSAHCIAVDPSNGARIGVSDYRRGGRPAAIGLETLALWDFSDRAGTELSETEHLGQYQWSGDLAGTVTNGQDQLRIRRDSPEQPMSASIDLRDSGLTRLAVEVKIDSAVFEGSKTNEQLRVAFLHGTVIPRVTARMGFGRREPQKIVVYGEASGDGTSIPPTVISELHVLNQPVLLRMEIDTDADTYQISVRPASEVAFKVCGTGRLDKDRKANYLNINPLNDFASDHEYLDVDRIELQRISNDP